jgi:GAF domain-containing protein/HAMP domain-containing protein
VQGNEEKGMEQATDSSVTEKKFSGKLIWAVLLLFLPVAVIPIAVWALLTAFETSAAINVVVLIVTFSVLCWLIWSVFKNIIRPLQDITYITRHYAEGYLHKRYEIDRNDEIGLLAHSLNQMAEKLSARFRSTELKAECRAKQIRAIAEIAQLSSSDSNHQTILQRTVDLIVERFHHYHAAIYFRDGVEAKMPLNAVYGSLDLEPLFGDPSSADHPKSIPEWVVLNNRSWIASDVSKDNYYAPLPGLPQTKSEAGIPINIGNEVIGVLDIHNTNINAFNDDDVVILEILARQIAFNFQKTNLFGTTPSSIHASSLLYEASHGIMSANHPKEIFRILQRAIQRTHCASAFFTIEQNTLQPVWISDSDGTLLENLPEPIPFDRFEVGEAFPKVSPILVKGLQTLANFPESIINLSNQLKYRTFVLFPLLVSGDFVGLLFVGETEKASLETPAIEGYNSLVEMMITALEKLHAVRSITDRLTELQTINTISKSVSTETSLSQLFEIIHHQIVHAIGDVNFLIALYDAASNMIEIPYMDDGETRTGLPQFPLGQGLTSIVIRTRQPLMIVEDTINRSRALGAMTVGSKPAKSWLGVPLLAGGEVIGALVIQDTEQEGRFDDDDMRLLTTLAAQVASAVRNTRLLESTQNKAEHDRQLYEITSKIRRATDMRSILKTTAEELGKTLGARKAEIKLTVDSVSQSGEGNSYHQEEEVSP